MKTFFGSTEALSCLAIASLLPQAVSAANISGDTVTTDLKVEGSITTDNGAHFKGQNLYLGPNKELNIRWFPSATSGTVGTVYNDIDRATGRFYWREHSTPENKMYLDENNNLTLYKTNGAAEGLVLRPDSGRIDIKGADGGGIYSGSTPIVTYATGGIISLTGTSLTTSGDSWVSGIRVGKGAGGIANNAVVGNLALNNNTTGNNNSAFGTNSLRGNTTGLLNSAFGSAALMNNQTGGSNVAVGVNALTYNASGSYNLALGAAAGATLANGSTPLTAPSSSIYIGADTRAATAMDSNAIVIGVSAVSGGSNTTVLGNDSVTATHLKGTTYTPGLDVDGDTVLRGDVTLEEAQGDISMGMYAE